MQNRGILIRFVLSPLLALTLTWGEPAALANLQSPPASPITGDANSTPLPSFGIYPKGTGPGTYFDVIQDAGESKRYTVVLANNGDEEQGKFEGQVFAVDVHTAVNGGFQTGGPDEEKTPPTTWLEFPNDLVTLEPGKGIERTFTVSIPTNTPPGEYVTALCFETAESLPVPGMPNLKQNLRKTIAFYLTIPGDSHPEFSIESVHMMIDPTWSGLEATINNSGNVRVRPEGRLTISSSDGEPILTSELAYDSFYAGQTGLIQYGLGDLLSAGEYRVTIELRDPSTGATAIVEDQPVTTTTQAALDAAAAPTVSFTEATGTLKPDAESPQFLLIDATLENTSDPLEDAELSLKVTRDGELVENYVVVSPLSLPQGETNVTNRYIPLDGWSSGTWAFTLSIQAKDRQAGISTILSSTSLGEPVVIP